MREPQIMIQPKDILSLAEYNHHIKTGGKGSFPNLSQPGSHYSTDQLGSGPQGQALFTQARQL